MFETVFRANFCFVEYLFNRFLFFFQSMSDSNNLELKSFKIQIQNESRRKCSTLIQRIFIAFIRKIARSLSLASPKFSFALKFGYNKLLIKFSQKRNFNKICRTCTPSGSKFMNSATVVGLKNKNCFPFERFGFSYNFFKFSIHMINAC